MGFPSPATDYVEDRISLDKHLITHPSATYYMTAGNTYWRAGIQQGALLIVDRSANLCDGSVVVCRLAGEFHIRRYRLHPYRHFESLAGDGKREKINPEFAGDDDGIFGVVTHAVNDLRTQEFDDNPVM
jgi:DNA polymerase V